MRTLNVYLKTHTHIIQISYSISLLISKATLQDRGFGNVLMVQHQNVTQLNVIVKIVNVIVQIVQIVNVIVQLNNTGYKDIVKLVLKIHTVPLTQHHVYIDPQVQILILGQIIVPVLGILIFR